MSLSELRKLTEEGVEFRSHLDGGKHMLTPERSMEIQRLLGSDIVMAFDQLVKTTDTVEAQRAAMERSMRWAARSRAAFDALGAGAQHEVIGVAEDDVRAARAHVLRLHRLDGRGGADGHEDGRADLAALHRDRAEPRLAVGGVDGELKTGHLRCPSHVPGRVSSEDGE
jgi:queuine tRNA-ribosyltransferase